MNAPATVFNTDPITAFMSAMADAGVAYAGTTRSKHDPFLADGQLHRYQIASDNKKRNAGWYVLHLDDPPSGEFGNWRSGGVIGTWSAKPGQAFTREERAICAQRNEESRRKREEAKRQQHEQARKLAFGSGMSRRTAWDTPT